MSNTSDLTPYSGNESVGNGAADLAGACIVGVVVGGIALAKWLSEETAQDRTARDRLHDEQRRERLQLGRYKDFCTARTETQAIRAVGLTIRELEPLILSAEKMGYRPETLSNRKIDRHHVLLRGAKGERMLISRTADERLALFTAGPVTRAKDLVRQHTLDRTMEFFRNRSMDARSVKLTTGDVQIHATGTNAPKGGPAALKIQVRTDGTLRVDVDRVKGRGCEQIVTGLANTVGARVADMKKKDAFFQLPGEPVNAGIRV